MKRLYIDDERVCPDGWTALRSHKEVEKWCARHGAPDVVSFDHDMGPSSKDGYQIAAWMIENGFMPGVAYVHSMNHYGALRIMSLLAENGVAATRV